MPCPYFLRSIAGFINRCPQPTWNLPAEVRTTKTCRLHALNCQLSTVNCQLSTVLEYHTRRRR
ncbi:MAG: hypothetical protein HC942_19700 [Microcoleus sp. SU_5_6]|nr:hypothetical protein [Microcoleus sp. SU_5_6]